ncbi:MAG: hypothetical protein LLG02_05500 [Pelosinus sp.]|nr:hypothetical protein [Pelosinus sp.]
MLQGSITTLAMRKLKQWFSWFSVYITTLIPNNRLTKQRGFLIIDAVLGTVVVTTALLGILYAFNHSTRSLMTADDNAYATYLAKQTLESIKVNDRIKQTDVTASKVLDTSNITNLNPQDPDTGVIYHIAIERPNLQAELGTIYNCLIPARVTVTWTDRVAKAQRHIAMVNYYYSQPLYNAPNDPPNNPGDPPNNPTGPPPIGLHNGAYDDHWNAMDKTKSGIVRDYRLVDDPASPQITADNGSGSGWFETAKSRKYQLWSKYYDNFNFPKQDADHNLNVALTTNWGSSSECLQFDNIYFTGNYNDSTPNNSTPDDTAQCDDFAFQCINDVRSYADASGDAKLFSNQWTLTPDYKNFKLDIYLKYIGPSAVASSTLGDISLNTNNRIVQNLLVKASDNWLYGPTAGSGTVKNLKVITTDSTPITKTIYVAVKDGYIQLKNVPAGYYSIGIKWTNDSFNGTNNDANILIANISLTKEQLK